jgi:gliding motility-associated-like protein
MRKTLLLLLLTSLSLSTTKLSFAQNDEKSSLIGNPSDDEVSANVITDLAGNTYIGGMINNDGLVVKQDNSPNQGMVWSKKLIVTSNPSNQVHISFLDLAVDTIFGCGQVEQANQSIGTFYFKMNATTGSLYWSKYEPVPDRYFSCMRYANGLFFMVGGIDGPNAQAHVQAVSSVNGQLVWDISQLFSGYLLPPVTNPTGLQTRFTNATEMVNGKMFITGTSQMESATNSARVPIIIGIDDEGYIFNEKYVLLPVNNTSTDFYNAGRIEYDVDRNLLLEIYTPAGIQNPYHGILLKCDTLGNLLFAKNYEIPGITTMLPYGLNETGSSYAMFGGFRGTSEGLYVAKTAKNGTLERCVGVSKPGISYINGWSNDLVSGNSDFSGGFHHFATTEFYAGSSDMDINQIVLDEGLNTINDCSEVFELFPVVTDVPLTIEDLGIGYDLNLGQIPEMLNPVTLQNQPVYTPCVGISISMSQNPGCTGSTITANTVGLTNPVFHWSDGTVGTSNSLSVTATDTIFVRVLDSKCCELIDTVVPVFVTSSLAVSLPADTSICMQTGNSYTISPVVSGAVSPVNYLWNDQSTGPTLSVSNSGNYWISVSDDCSTQIDSFTIVVNYFPELDLPATLDTCFDIGVGFSYTAQGSPGSYQWSSGSQTATEWISQEGTYLVTLTNGCGTTTDSLQVRRITDVDLYFPEDSIKVCEKQLSVSLLHVETNYSLEIFAPDGDLVGTHLSESGWYLLHAFNPCGEKWDSIYVNLQNEQFFYLPNSFTPNNDGNNDRFEFKGENIEVRDVHIFNRWGEEIFTESGNFNGWNGMYRGEICPDGIYSVHLIYEDCFGLPTVFKGHVNLIK